MAMYGANPEELEHLGATLRRQIESINGVVGTVGGVLAGTTWMGPARDRFQADWESVFTGPAGALTRLAQAFEAAGADCARRSAELRRVMGAAG